MTEVRFLEPLDVLFLRGNKLFGEAGQHGEMQMPPWPSVVAGAIRSRMLADGDGFAAFALGRRPAGVLGEVLGTPVEPGSFRIAWFSVARRNGQAMEPVKPLPADLFAEEGSDRLLYLEPQRLPEGLQGSLATPQIVALRQMKSTKPQGGVWLNGAGLAAYLRGQSLRKGRHTTEISDLWRSDPRLGIALDSVKRAAEKGRLYTSEGIAMRPDFGFLVGVDGAEGLVPNTGLIRFGGDGRGAHISSSTVNLPEPDWERIASEKIFRLVLATPGLFEGGWRLPGMENNNVTWRGPDGLTARLISAAVPRAQVVSGWDIAKGEPKKALRAVPAGSVYWFEAAESDGSAWIAALKKLAVEGFGCFTSYPDRSRLSEGFNNVMVANWAAESE